MVDEPSTVPAPPEAADPSLSSAAKDAFFANEPPAEHKHRTYDIKARGASIEDADFDVEETNAKGGDEVE